MRERRVLVTLDHYLPGFLGGGPVRTVSNMVEALHGEVDFHIVTRNRDLGVTERFPGVETGRWLPVARARLFYFAGEPSLAEWRALLRASECDVLYLNSFFSPRFTTLPLLALRGAGMPPMRVVLAPRGEFSPGAIAINGLKKRAFVRLARAAGLYRGVTWHASNEMEACHIRAWFDERAEIRIAPNPPSPAPADAAPRPLKAPGRLRVAFLSRIARKKNLDAALRMVSRLRGEVEFDVFGPREDPQYWAECEQLIAQVPPHIRVTWRGPVPHEQVRAALAGSDIFLFPTRGENYGHVVAEALAAGCPLVLSDQTPWRGLRERGVGWDLPLGDEAAFVAALQQCVEMGGEEFAAMSEAARAFGRERALAPETVALNRALFVPEAGEQRASGAR